MAIPGSFAAVEVCGIKKTFQVKQKTAGLRSSFSSLVTPTVRSVEAVRGVDFSLPTGEILAFIGPNGAGKSTMIKILTGILHPSVGTATVLGITPWKDRKKLAYQIGTVFGQKPQLHYHLPAGDTFKLFSKMYELDADQYKNRRGFLVEALELQDFLKTPVRKLSLGQRMKCEIAASLLHDPKIIFLDEPTIGLDVVAKQQIRTAIQTLHEELNTTIFLTSHDAGDIESLCRRAIIINHGSVIFDDKIEVLRKKFLQHKVLTARFSSPLESVFAMAGVAVADQTSYALTVEFDTNVVASELVVKNIFDFATCSDITISDPSLEETIHEIYTEKGNEL